MSAFARVTWRDRDVLDFHALLLQLWRGRWWIVATALGVALFFRIYAAVTTPMYLATTVLMPVSGQRISLGYSIGSSQPAVATLPTAGGMAALTRLGLDTSQSATEEALAVLESREFGYRFIKDLNLMPILFASQWDAETAMWTVPDAERPTEADAFEYFDRDVRTIERDRRTGFVILQIIWPDPEVAAAWANALVERLNDELRQRAIARTDALLGFLDDELQSVTVVDSRIVTGLLEAQVNERMLASVSDEFAFRVVDRALPPPKGEIVWPPTLLLMVAGGMFGSMLGAMCVIVFRVFRPIRGMAATRT